MKARSILAPLLLLALSGCGMPGKGSSSQQPATINVTAIQQAYQDLLSNYVDPPNAAGLLQSAYQGAVNTLPQPDRQNAPALPLSGNSATDWSSFQAAYQQLAGRYGSQAGGPASLQNAALTAMAASLNDCLTEYYDPAALGQRQAELNGQQTLAGIGVLIKNIPGHPTVLRILDGPAKSSGLQPGDEIVAVNGKPTAGETFETVRNSIRGPVGQSVTVTVTRPGANQPLSFTIQRAQISAPVIEAAVIGGTTGYLHLYSFPQGIDSEIGKAMSTFDQRNVDGIIVDLRANTGGDHDTILRSLSYFLKDGTVVEQDASRGGDSQLFKVTGSNLPKQPKPVTVLVDSDTQAGGELFAKAMQEEGGYRVVGNKTAGCAAAGRMFDLSGGAGIEISTGKILSGKGANLNRTGVTPDVAVDYPPVDMAAGKDPQLSAALQVLLGGGPAPSQPNGSASTPTSASSQPARQAPAGQPGGSPVIKPLIKPNGVTVLK